MNKKFLRVVGGIMIAAGFIYGFLTFIEVSRAGSPETFDLLGRHLIATPWWLSQFLSMKTWAGPKWFGVNLIVFWSLVGVGGWLLARDFEDNR